MGAPSGDRIGRIADLIAVTCAIIVTAVLVRQQFRQPAAAIAPKPRSRTSEPPRQVDNWRFYGTVGHRIGLATAPVTIVEFADFECPFCARCENGALKEIRDRYPSEVALVFRHWPLTIHRLAYAAARASECAAEQGRFFEFHDALFAAPDSLGTKSFDDFATASGVTDVKAFRACYGRQGPVAAIEADIAAIKALGGHGTPTILVNDLMVFGALDTARLDSLVRQALGRVR